MKFRFLWILSLLFIPLTAHATTAALQGSCTTGGVRVITQGASSTNPFMASYPKCTVTVYITGTLTPATIYSDAISTPLSNPFTANSAGAWLFFATTGIGYDVVMSAGQPAFPIPVTLTDLMAGGDGGGGGGTPCGASGDVQLNEGGAFGCDTGILTNNVSTHTLFTQNQISANINSKLTNGWGNTDLFQTGGGNNGAANFFTANPAGNGFFPPTSISTEALAEPPSGAKITDSRANGLIGIGTDVGQNFICSLADGLYYVDDCRIDYITQTHTNVQSGGRSLRTYGPGYNLGSSTTSATGWSTRVGMQQHMDAWTRGIKEMLDQKNYSHSVGDHSGVRSYNFSDGGAVEAAAEGGVASYFSMLESGSFFHGTIVSGGTTGSNYLQTAVTSGQNYFTDGAYVLDTQTATATATITGTTFPTVAAGGTGYTDLQFSGASFPASTAWGVSTTATTSPANGKWQIPVPQTIIFTLGTAPASPGPFVANVPTGPPACIVGVNSFAEQVAITGVGSATTTQSVTFTTRYGWNAGDLLMQGGMCGQFPTNTATAWKTTGLSIGSFSATDVVQSLCTHGNCTSTGFNQPSVSLFYTTVLLSNSFGESLAFYPGAEVIGTATPGGVYGQQNNVQLATNTVAWANGDTIIDPHPAAQAITAQHLIAGQTTPCDGINCVTQTVAWIGSTPARADTLIQNSGPVTSIFEYDNEGITASTYGQFFYAKQLPQSAFVDLHNSVDGNVRIFWGPGGFNNSFYSLAGGGWRFLAGTNYNDIQAKNVPISPTANGQIPVSYRTDGIAPNYAPVTPSGDLTLSTAGVFTLATVNSNIGPCGDATHVCQVTLNGKGLATSATAVAITGGSGVSSINSTAGAFTFTGAGVSCTTTTCTFSGTGSGVTSFAAPSGSWPAWLVPTVTNSTTTPSLAVAASTIPVSAGGTGTTTPGLVAGTNVTITGTWPNQTVNSTAAGTGTVTHTAGALTANALVIGNGAADVKVDTGCSTDGAGNVTCASYAANGSGPSQFAATYNSTPLAPGSATTAVYGVNSSGQAVISEAGGAAARVCDATNGVCAAGTVTAVTGSSPIASSGGTTPAISCPTCGVTGSGLNQFASTTSAQLAGVLSDETGTGLAVFGTSPTLITPNLGTPTSLTLTSATGLPISTGVSGLATGIATFLATPSSANLAAALTDETGTGAAVFATSPTLITPVLGVATATSINGTTIPASVTLAETISSGTATLGTSAIASGACATVVTVAATGVATTDTIAWNPNASIKAVTGYAPSTSGGLTIAAYPTSGNVNFDVCNWSASSIAPGAVTLNWRVVR